MISYVFCLNTSVTQNTSMLNCFFGPFAHFMENMETSQKLATVVSLR